MEMQLGVPTQVTFWVSFPISFILLLRFLWVRYFFPLHLGFGQHQGMQGSQMMPPGTGLKPPIQGNAPQGDRAMQPNQQNLRMPGMVAPNQLDNGKQDSANSKPQDPSEAEKKASSSVRSVLSSFCNLLWEIGWG